MFASGTMSLWWCLHAHKECKPKYLIGSEKKQNYGLLSSANPIGHRLHAYQTDYTQRYQGRSNSIQP